MSKKTKAQIEQEMKEELLKQGVDVNYIDNFGDVYGDDDDPTPTNIKNNYNQGDEDCD